MNTPLNRRSLLRISPYALASVALATCSQSLSQQGLQGKTVTADAPSGLPATPACEDIPTAPQTEGPFYTPDSPERRSLLDPNQPGTPIIITGQVLSPQCDPIGAALLDVWHTNAQGEYDNEGYTFRGHQFTDAEGRYWIETIVPGLYPGRTRHIHVKVQAPQQPVLTTQLYFPQEPTNQGDFLFNPQLLMALSDSHEEKRTAFNFNFVLT